MAPKRSDLGSDAELHPILLRSVTAVEACLLERAAEAAGESRVLFIVKAALARANRVLK